MVERMNLLVLPVGANCNLNCAYCYHGGVKRYNQMPEDILGKIIEDGFAAFPEINFIWHGGEPLLAGLNFFKEAVTLQRIYCQGKPYKNSIQTNATLIDEDWANFFHRNDFFVSTSVDGPARMHNQNRRSIVWGGTSVHVFQGIAKIKRNQKIGIVLIANSANIDYPREVYKKMREIGNRGFKIHFFSQTTEELDYLVPDEKAAVNFFKTIFDLWLEEDDPSFRIRTFTDMIRAYLGARVINCAAGRNRCRFFAAIDPKGDVYSCHRFLGQDEFRLGNIMEKSMGEILERGASVYQQMAQLPKKCLNCKWINWCGGDCSFDRWLKNKKFTDLSPNCGILKKVFEHVEGRLKEF